MGFKIFSLSIFIVVLVVVSDVLALPFNDDMVDGQIKTGQVMRPKVKGTVPRGSLSYHVGSMEAATKLVRPNKEDSDAPVRGKLLFRTNCYPCHGDISSTPESYKKSKARQKMKDIGGVVPAVPNIGLPDYQAKGDYRSDGYFYGVIHFGLGRMSPIGWKLSPNETWDIVSYIREVQQGQ